MASITDHIRRDSFPHGISCRPCREHAVCNYCGGNAPKDKRCTNGRCPKCCQANCQHVTEGR
jgi:hypothetical protein